MLTQKQLEKPYIGQPKTNIMKYALVYAKENLKKLNLVSIEFERIFTFEKRFLNGQNFFLHTLKFLKELLNLKTYYIEVLKCLQ